jgi:hypothetical protein
MIEAVEVCKGGAMSVPMEHSMHREVACGLVVAWLR